MKTKGRIIDVVVVIGLLADILSIASSLPAAGAETQMIEPAPYELSIDISLNIEVK